MKQTKKTYVSPHIEVIELENEGVIASSVNVTGMPGDTWSPKSSARSMYSGSNAGSSDLEDMINDILTIEN